MLPCILFGFPPLDSPQIWIPMIVIAIIFVVFISNFRSQQGFTHCIALQRPDQKLMLDWTLRKTNRWCLGNCLSFTVQKLKPKLVATCVEWWWNSKKPLLCFLVFGKFRRLDSFLDVFWDFQDFAVKERSGFWVAINQEQTDLPNLSSHPRRCCNKPSKVTHPTFSRSSGKELFFELNMLNSYIWT